MYYFKTECLERENMSPNYFYDLPTMNQSSTGNGDQPLGKAITIIEQLRDNLAFVLKLNESLTQQNQQLKANAERTTKKANADALGFDKKLKQIESEKQEIIEVLEHSKSTLLATQNECEQKRKEIDRCNRIIYQQKKAYEELEQNFMNQSLNYAGDTSSLNIGKSDIHYMSQLQRENTELANLVKRYEQQAQKNQTRLQKLEKENIEFRKWMASVLGLQKVVEGSEKILMKEISNRMLPA